MNSKNVDDLRETGQIISRIALLIGINVLAYHAVPRFLLYAGSDLNGIFLPEPPYWVNGHLREGLSPFYRAGGLILFLEEVGLLFGIYRFNRWYCRFLPDSQGSALTWLISSITIACILTTGAGYFIIGWLYSLFST
jgi:hypothetical protein